eukprot:Skav226487  [mRNA]  locus=scaffold744:48590:50497:- [translate_table: standard]
MTLLTGRHATPQHATQQHATPQHATQQHATVVPPPTMAAGGEQSTGAQRLLPRSVLRLHAIPVASLQRGLAMKRTLQQPAAR